MKVQRMVGKRAVGWVIRKVVETAVNSAAAKAHWSVVGMDLMMAEQTAGHWVDRKD